MRQRVKPIHIPVVRELADRYVPAYDENWLPNHPSMAFIVCLGQGPWGHERRTNVAVSAGEKVIDLLKDRPEPIDLAGLTPSFASGLYPLEWQNRTLRSMIWWLRSVGVTFHDVTDRWLDMLIHNELDEVWRSIPKELFAMCRAPARGTKTLWMFVRDYLQAPAFPIDRRVRARLREVGLPVDSWYMTELCLAAEVDTCTLARGMFYSLEDKRREEA